jgi:hypothetical protein
MRTVNGPQTGPLLKRRNVFLGAPQYAGHVPTPWPIGGQGCAYDLVCQPLALLAATEEDEVTRPPRAR